MRLHPFPQRFSFLTLLVLGLTVALRSSAQRQYATTVISFTNTTNASAAVDGSTATEATLQPSLLAGAASLRVSFATPVQPGERAGLLLRTGGTLALAALSGIEVHTYLGSSTTSAQDFALSSLVSLGVLNAGVASADFVATKPFDQIELTASGLANAYTIGFVDAFANVSPLPVELVVFQGKATSAGVQLSWQTASELHNARFVVERSATGDVDKFTALSQVAGAGTTTQTHRYQWLDAAPLALGYYRLRQVDNDGQAQYSPVVAVQAAPSSTELAAYPNPATETVTIAAPVGAHLQLYDQQGRLLPLAALVPGQSLNVRELPAGLYLVRDAATGHSIRFVKTGSEHE